MSNERLLQQSVEFTEIADSEMEQISGGNNITPIFSPCGSKDGGYKHEHYDGCGHDNNYSHH